MPRSVHNSAVELACPLFHRKRKRGNTGLCSAVGLRLPFSIVGRCYSAGSSFRFSPFFSDRFERRGLVYVGADINNPAQTQATNGSGYWQSHGCVPAQGSGRGYTSENARFEDTHFQSGTDLVGADWEPTLSVANGQPVSQTDALNNTTSYTYNSLGKVLTVTDAESNVTSYTYNLLGQMTSLTDPEGNATSWTYDSMGRVVSETNEKNAIRAYEYDDLGRLIQTTDRNGRVIQYEYDYLGRQTAEKWLDSNNNVIGYIEYTFDGNNNLLTVTDSISGVNYEYRYDALNRRIYTYVDSDELSTPVEFTYYYNTSDLTVTETLTGLIDGVVAPYYQNVYQYDVFGRLESISQTGTGLTAKSVEYFYNQLGQRTGATYKQNGGTVSESAWLYDVVGKVTAIQHKTAADDVFAEYGLTWDAGNNITEFETVDGTVDYISDKTGQITGADYSNTDIPDESYSFDNNGNRTNTGYVTGENNETLSDGMYRYSYDNEGNRTEKFLWTDANNDGIIDASEKTLVQSYNWDYRNRLESVTNYENGIAKEVIDYLYDYLNLMIERTVTDAATSALQSSDFNIYSNGQIVLEYDTTSSVDVVKSVNLWGTNIDELVAVEQIAQSVNDNNVILWTYGDHLNSVRDVVLYDSIVQTAAVVNHLIYNAFGILVSSTNAAANPTTISPLLKYRYTGKFFDDSTGLQNNINRWYDNTTGKWLSVDPIGFKGGDVNQYRYVGSHPLSYCDILGLWTHSGLLSEYKKIYKNNPDAIRSYNIVINYLGYQIEHTNSLYWNEWSVDHQNKKIYISDTSYIFTRSDTHAAKELYQIFADEFYNVTNLPETGEHFFYRIFGGVTGVVGGVGETITGGLMLSAPEPTQLSKVGGYLLITNGVNNSIESFTQLFNRSGGYNIGSELFGVYGYMLNGKDGEDIARLGFAINQNASSLVTLGFGTNTATGDITHLSENFLKDVDAIKKLGTEIYLSIFNPPPNYSLNKSYNRAYWKVREKLPPKDNELFPKGKENIELSHTYFPKRSNLPGWIKNHPLNLNPIYATQHAINDPCRYQTTMPEFKKLNSLNHPFYQLWGRMPEGHRIVFTAGDVFFIYISSFDE